MAGAWLKALKDLTTRKPTEEEYDLIAEEVTAEGRDRGAALVTSAALERSLKKFIKSRMVPLSSTLEINLFERDAPLSTFSKLIRVAYAFGLIDAKIRQECDYIREIRNAFAHVPAAVSFDTPAIRTACLLLTQHYDAFEGGLDPNHPRAYYVGAATKLMIIFNTAAHSPDPKLPLSLHD